MIVEAAITTCGRGLGSLYIVLIWMGIVNNERLFRKTNAYRNSFQAIMKVYIATDTRAGIARGSVMRQISEVFLLLSH